MGAGGEGEGSLRLWFGARGLMTVRSEARQGGLEQEQFCFRFQHFFFFLSSSGLIELL